MIKAFKTEKNYDIFAMKCEVILLNMMDVLIEKYRQEMFDSAKKDGLSSSTTIKASQQLDRILNIGMHAEPSKWMERKNQLLN
jgi:Spo0E like sporulation regulatory protein